MHPYRILTTFVLGTEHIVLISADHEALHAWILQSNLVFFTQYLYSIRDFLTEFQYYIY
jgi:hypothetical protein